MPKLTKGLIDRSDSKEKDYIIWDDKISGFGLKVTPAGRKSYLLKYRTSDGRQRKPAIGVHGNITCEQARTIAQEWKGLLAQGKDPCEQKLELKNSPMVSYLCDRFIEDYSKVRRKPATIYNDTIFVDKYIKPAIGSLKIVAITKNDIQKLHLDLKDKPAMANRILGAVHTIFRLGEEWGYRKQNTNPCVGIKKYKEGKKERFLSQDELKKLGEVLEEAEKDGSESPYFIALIRLLLMTGARLREIMHAKWSYVDFEKGLLKLPDSKTGQKSIHLPPQAIDVLENIPRLAGNEYIICGKNEGKPMINARKPWTRLRKKAGLEDMRLHDLRHSFASICIDQGIGMPVLAKLLGHSQLRTTQRYAHLADDPVKSASIEIGASIRSALGGKNG